MRRLRDLSYRVKVPLAMSAVIVIVSAIMAAVLGARIYADARGDLLASAESLGRTLARALTPAMLRDDVWQAYETIVAPLGGDEAASSIRQSITVVDADGNVYASSDPGRFPKSSVFWRSDPFTFCFFTLKCLKKLKKARKNGFLGYFASKY